jgi:hypothetical protein
MIFCTRLWTSRRFINLVILLTLVFRQRDEGLRTAMA